MEICNQRLLDLRSQDWRFISLISNLVAQPQISNLQIVMTFQFACPFCKTTLQKESDDRFVCPQDGRIYNCVDGIWRFLLPEREKHFAQFIEEYETVRLAEGRQSEVVQYYRALPFQDLSGQMSEMWQSRAKTFQLLCEHVIQPTYAQAKRPLNILDCGAGNGWLSYQLSKWGHHLAALDLTTNNFDGLGTFHHYDANYLPTQAEFSHLPFEENAVDIVAFNASFHYAENYEMVLQEAWHVTKAEGIVVICDSPLYQHPENGRKMVQERESQFQQKYGFPSNALNSENFLWKERLDQLAKSTNTIYQLIWRTSTTKQFLRKAKIALRQQREPARFPLIVFKKKK